jgi:y4mF family transcriptional regulator
VAKTLEVGEIAGTVRTRRRAMGMSQAQLAERAHVSRKWVSEIECGKESVQLKPLLAVLEVLHLPLTMPAVDDVEINRRIRARARRTSFGGKLAQLGITTVALDEDGHLTRYHPDGSTTSAA